jgi:branched-chain amino acid transport system substrate-binding protein
MHRREFVKAAGGASTAGLVGLAGCAQNQDGSDGEANQNGSDGGANQDGGDSTSPADGSDGGSISGEITLGVLAQTSGPFGYLGRPILNGAQLGAETISQNTNLSVDIAHRDTELTPGTAVQKSRELIENENVDALFGVSSSAVAKAVSNFAAANNTPLIISAAQTPDITTSECRATTFRTCDYLTPMQTTLARTTAQLSGGTRVAALAPDNIFGDQTWNSYIREYKRRVSGAEIVNETFPAVAQGDYQSEIQQTLDAEPDIIYTSFYPGGFISWAQQARQFDLFERDIEIVWGALVTEVPKEMGTNMPRCIGGPLYYHSFPDIEANNQFVNDFSDRFGSLPAANAGEAYKGVDAIYAALNSEGAVSKDALMNGLAGLEFESVQGKTEIRAEDHQAVDENMVSGRIGPVEGQDWYGFTEESIVISSGPDIVPKPVCNL